MLAALFLGWQVCIASSPISNELTHELDGVEITYAYQSGDRYQVRYTAQGVKYRYLSGEDPDEWWGPFPYKAFRVREEEYFLGWYEKGFGDQITHLVNLQSKTLYGSGIIVKKRPGKKDLVIEHFQRADIKKISRAVP